MGKTPGRNWARALGIPEGDRAESMMVHTRGLNLMKANVTGTMRTPSEQKR